MKDPNTAPPYAEFGDWLLLACGNHTHQWLADYLVTSRVWVSRLCNGDARPSARLAGQIAAFFDADPGEIARMVDLDPDLVEQAYKFVKGLGVQEDTIWASIDLFRRAIDVAHDYNEAGRNQKAYDHLQYWIRRIKNRLNIEEANPNHSAEINELRILLAHAINQKVGTMHLRCSKEEVLLKTEQDYKTVGLLVNRIRYSSELVSTRVKSELLLQANTLEIESHSLRADGFYIAGKWRNGVNKATNVVENATEVVELQRSSRALLLCEAHLGEFSSVTKSRCRDLLDGSFESNGQVFLVSNHRERAALWEGLGRVAVMQGRVSEVVDAFTQAENSCDESERLGNPMLSHRFQVKRGKLIAYRDMRNSKLGYDPEYLAKEGFHLASLYGSARHMSQIVDIARALGIWDKIKAELHDLTQGL